MKKKEGGREATRDALFKPKLDHALIRNHQSKSSAKPVSKVSTKVLARARVEFVAVQAKRQQSKEAGTQESPSSQRW